jgi:hypothetical protein
MAEADWTALNATTNKALEGGNISKGVSGAAFTPPAGGGSFIYGFHALQPVSGVAGIYYTGISSFNPIAAGKGGSIRAAMRRYSAGAGYAPFIALLSGTQMDVSNAYLLGMSNSDPSQIALRKGVPNNGLNPTDTTILRVSDETFSSSALWHHLRLDVIVNPQGDVVLNVFKNDIDANNVDGPVWEEVPGMDPYVDDANGVLTGSLPLVGGLYGMVGHYNEDSAGKVSLVDHLEFYRQLSP